MIKDEIRKNNATLNKTDDLFNESQTLSRTEHILDRALEELYN